MTDVETVALREELARAIFNGERAARNCEPVGDIEWRQYWSPGGPVAYPSVIAKRADAVMDIIARERAAALAAATPLIEARLRGPVTQYVKGYGPGDGVSALAAQDEETPNE